METIRPPSSGGLKNADMSLTGAAGIGIDDRGNLPGIKNKMDCRPDGKSWHSDLKRVSY